ncbi:MAG: hypothetical protein H7832_03955 [Magnetococcus sp. DMHC-6]
MQYVITKYGNIVYGPQRWNPFNFTNALSAQGISVSFAENAPMMPVKIDSCQILPVIDDGIGQIPFEPRIHRIVTETAILESSVVITSAVENRPLTDVQTEQRALLKERTQNAILTMAPDYAQRNAALGLLDATETQFIKDHISTCRTICHTTEAAIAAALDGVAVISAMDNTLFP